MNKPSTIGVALALVLFIPGILAPTTEAKPNDLNRATLSGWFSVIWGDGGPGSDTGSQEYLLTDDHGQPTQLLLSDELTQPLGGILALNQKRVVIEGAWIPVSAQGAGTPVLQAQSIRLDEQPRPAPAADYRVAGPQPWLSILCKFSDVAAEPEPLPYFQAMYGAPYPGLDHYWRELSYNTINTAGSGAVGWFRLPHPRSYYVYNARLDYMRAANDCAAVADPFVYFPSYVGINLMFNADLDGKAWGGNMYMTLDGVFRSWRMTWEPPWGYQNIGAIEHEMGHGFGMPHSSGAYGQTYDNQWDVMSDIWSSCYRGGVNHGDLVYGCTGQHTIALHKDYVSWIPANRKLVATSASRTTITLERLALPAAEGYLMARIPIQGSSIRFYTLEARRLIGYDNYNPIPGDAVVIHNVDMTRERPAYVVDIDGNGNTGDAGAMWLPGETLTDAGNGIQVCVNSMTATGFIVTIGLGVPADCSFQPDYASSILQADPGQPQAGQRVTLVTRLINWGGTSAQGVVVTSTIPNSTTLVVESAATTQGTVAGSGPLIFNVGTMAYNQPVTLSLSVTVSTLIISPTVLSGPVTIAWTGGSLVRAHSFIVNGRTVYLPVILQ